VLFGLPLSHTIAGAFLSLALLAAAWFDGHLPVLYLAVLAPLIFVSVLAVAAFLMYLRTEDIPAFESHWGGLGGALGGWRISRALSTLILSVFLCFVTGMVARHAIGAARAQYALAHKSDAQSIDKYQSVLRYLSHAGFRLETLSVRGGRVYLSGVAPTEQAKNGIWTQIKLANPKLDDIHADIRVEARSAQAGEPQRGQ
jgi:hypothetical protein